MFCLLKKKRNVPPCRRLFSCCLYRPKLTCGEGGNTRIQPRTRPKSRGSLADFYLERKVFELLQAVPDVRSHPGGRRHVVLGLQGGDTHSQPVSGRVVGGGGGPSLSIVLRQLLCCSTPQLTSHLKHRTLLLNCHVPALSDPVTQKKELRSSEAELIIE